MDNDDPFFLIGDLNMDLKSGQGADLKDYLLANDLKNFVNDYTRVSTSFYKKQKKSSTSKTLIDVVIHNQNFF